MKKIGVILSILTVLTLSFITNNNVSAVSDLVYTIDNSPSNNTTSLSLCNNNCSDYDYLYIEVLDSSFLAAYNPSISVFAGDSTSGFNFRPVINHKILCEIPSNAVSYTLNVNYSNISSGSYKVVFTNDNPFATGVTPEGTLDVVANGTYDVTNYASVNVDVDSSLPPFVNIVIDAFWKYHVAFAAAIPAILAIFFIFRFIKGRVK